MTIFDYFPCRIVFMNLAGEQALLKINEKLDLHELNGDIYRLL